MSPLTGPAICRAVALALVLPLLASQWAPAAAQLTPPVPGPLPATPNFDALANQLSQMLQVNQTQATLFYEKILTGIIKLLPTVNPLTNAGADVLNILARMLDMEADTINKLTGNVLANVIFILNNSVGSGSTNYAELSQQLAATIISGIANSPGSSDFESALANLYGAAPTAS